MSHLNYYDAGQDSTPLPQYVEVKEAKRKAHRAFLYGSVIFGVLGALTGAAFGETISIGRNSYYHGESTGQTTVTINPSDVPGQLAIVTLTNQHVNQGADDGDYSLTMDGVTFGVQFIWDADPLLGSDRIVITPPAGITCEPTDCGVTVMEGAVGSVVLFDYLGF